MLQIFRRHQKVIFFFTTILIVFSFVFFGTFQAFLSHSQAPDEVVYVTKGGTKIRHSQMQQMVHYLSNERRDPITARDLLENNFFNQGWISNTFLHLEAAKKLFLAQKEINQELMEEKLLKERTFSPYINPMNLNMSAEAIWAFVAPEINENLKKLRETTSWEEAFSYKCALYSAQRRFPPAMLAQTLLYSGGQSPGGYDPRLLKGDLGLFGYKTLQDWFGEPFVKQCAKLVFEAADLAKEKGFKVTRAENQHEIHNCLVKSYKEVAGQIQDQVPHPFALYQLYLRHRGLTEAGFESLNETLLLCRRLLDQYSSVPLVDALSFEGFHSYAYEYATVKLKQLPSYLKLDQEKWPALEAYLKGTSPRVTAREFSLDPYPVEMIRERSPFLVGREYAFYYNEVSLKQLESKVSLKETWAWEADAQNREAIEKAFPDLARDEESWEERLSKLSSTRRQKLDAFARGEIVKSHPEWVEKAFQESIMKETSLLVADSGACKEFPLKGIMDIPAFLSALESTQELHGYTQDKKHFYRVLRNQDLTPKRILTFKECLELSLEKELVSNFQGKEASEDLKKYFMADDSMEECHHRFDFLFACEDEEYTSYTAQFMPIVSTKTVSRADPELLDVEEVFQSEVGEWKNPRVQEGVLFSYELIDHQVDTSPPVKQLAEMQEKLHKELREHQVSSFVESYSERVR